MAVISMEKAASRKEMRPLAANKDVGHCQFVPQGLKPADSAGLMYGLKPVPFERHKPFQKAEAYSSS
jgi:hypothetical protein